jgi:predicted transcriptional regulator
MAKKGTHDRAFGLRMDEDIVKALEKIAAELDVSASWVVRRACQQFIQRYQASKSTVVALAVEAEPAKDASTSQGF